MRRTPRVAVVTAMVLGIGFGAGFGPAGASAVAPPAKKTPAIKPPVIVESFTLLPCDRETTIGMEGCEEHQLVAADKRIDREVRFLSAILYDNAARTRLVQAETSWFAFRQADSRSEADIYEGGSEADVAALVSAVNDDRARSTDLYGFFQGLEQDRSHPPKFP